MRKVDIATSQDGEYRQYRQYRIPGMIVTNDGTIITTYDGRKTVADLPSNIDNIVRISKDGGATWRDQVVARAGAYPRAYGDPAMGYNPETNRVFRFYSGSVTTGFFAGAVGTSATDPAVVQNLMSYSDDNGETWTDVNITEGTKNPAWAGTFVSSGMTTFISTGPYKGRMVAQYVLRVGGQNGLASAWTDDNGATWHYGDATALGFADENKTAATSDGNLLLNLRAGGLRKRAISTDGGQSYGPITSDPALVDPADNGSITRVYPKLPASDPKSKWMISTNNNDSQIRMNTTIRLSCDDGQTWPIAKVLETGASAYSTADMLNADTVAVLYERKGYANITFASFPLSELDGQCAPLSIPGSTTLNTGATTNVPVTITNQNTTALPAGQLAIDGGSYIAGTAATPVIAPGASAVVPVPVAVTKDQAAQTVPLKATYTAAGKSSATVQNATTAVGTGAPVSVYSNGTTQTFTGTTLADITAQLPAVKSLASGSVSITFNTTAVANAKPQVLFGAAQGSVDDHDLLMTINNGGRPYFEIRPSRATGYLANQSPASTLNVADGSDHTMVLTAAGGKTTFSVDGTQIYTKNGEYFFASLPNLDTLTMGGVRFKTSADAGPTEQWKFNGTIKNVSITAPATGPAVLTPAPSLKIEPILDVYNYTSPPGLGINDKGSYMVRLTNTGNVPLTGLAATSSIELGSCVTGTLAPGANLLCRAVKHTFTQADVDARGYTPTVTVTATAAGAPFTATANGDTVVLPEPFTLPAAPAGLAAAPGGCAPTPVRPVSAVANTEESTATNGKENTPASFAVDGNNATFWSSGWGVGTGEFPNWITADLGTSKTLCGLTYVARQNNSNGNIGDYRIYVSDDASSFGTPVAGGRFTTGNAAQSVHFAAPATGRYVKLVSYSDIGAAKTETTTVAELSLKAVDPNYVAPTGLPALLPKPNSVTAGTGPSFGLSANTPLVTDEAAAAQGRYLADLFKPATGFTLTPVRSAPATYPAITLSAAGPADLGEQGYTLSVKGSGVVITGHTAEGVFNGIQTLRQLLPAQINARTVQAGAWTVAPVEIADKPRFSYRGAMLDVGRRYYPMADVKQFLDYMAEYKLNAFHFHLTEDQGWRLAIDAYPALTQVGASVQSGIPAGTVDNGAAGPWFYTKAQYKELVDYAAARFIEVIPEIDGPGHAGAAMAAVPNLNCNDQALVPWTAFGRGPNFCLSDPTHRNNVKAFLTTVFADVAGQTTTSNYIHVGGDESAGITAPQFTDYTQFVNDAVTATGKKVMAWNSWTDGVGLPAGGVLQNYAQASGDPTLVGNVASALANGNQLIMSPADRTYLDMKYDATTAYGLTWINGRYIDLARAYQWEPTTAVPAVSGGGKMAVAEEQILGVEAALWADATNQNGTLTPWAADKPFDPVSKYMDHMLFPRLPAVAEIAWSAKADRANDPAQFDDFQARLVNHAQGWDAEGIGYYRAAGVPWKAVGAPALPAAASVTLSDLASSITFDGGGNPVFTVTGTVAGSGAQLVATVNGTAHPLTASGPFSFSAPAVAGGNSATVSGVDSSGAQALLSPAADSRLGSLAATAGVGKWTVSGSGLKPNEDVALTLHSDPIALGTVRTDANGAFSTTVAIPAAAPAGSHHIRAVGAGGVAVTAVTVAEPEVEPTDPGVTPTPTDPGTTPPTDPGTTTPPTDPGSNPGNDPGTLPVQGGSNGGNGNGNGNGLGSGQGGSADGGPGDGLASTGAPAALLTGLGVLVLMVGACLALVRSRRSSRHS